MSSRVLSINFRGALDSGLAYALSKVEVVSFDYKVYSYDLKKPVKARVRLLLDVNECMKEPDFDLLEYYEEHYLMKSLYGGN